MTNMMGFDVKKFVNDTVSMIKHNVSGKAITAVSGGVDSSVTAFLAHKALGSNLKAIFIDTGLLRKGEPEQVIAQFSDTKINFVKLDKKRRFLNTLKGVVNPEQKRKVIGETFIRIFEEEARAFGANYLIQGTIAPDWIESGGGLRETIKTHHNVGGIPADITLTLIEPLRDLYKDEVRALARYLKLNVSERQPFPGPGLAIRVLGEVTEEKLTIARESNYIVEQEIQKAVKAGIIHIPWQFFAVVLSTRSVGVHGDKRAYGYTVALRIVESIDGMSATFSKIPYNVLENISVKITNTLKQVNRVVYDITNKPPATIEWE